MKCQSWWHTWAGSPGWEGTRGQEGPGGERSRACPVGSGCCCLHRLSHTQLAAQQGKKGVFSFVFGSDTKQME